ncbi:MAG: hypothetical protein J5563_05260 [Clostridia bacterium]|nr:hypothetical protein [Clostridia bacterium]
MKKFFKYNRPAAIIALVAIIVLSVWLGGMRSVSSLKKNVLKAYFTDYSSGGCVADDMAKYLSYSQKILGIAEANGVRNEEYSSAVNSFADVCDSPFTAAPVYEKLRKSADTVYNILYAANLDSSVRNSLISYYYEMTSTSQRLANNSAYNKIARKYNSASVSFPASLYGSDDVAVVFR